MQVGSYREDYDDRRPSSASYGSYPEHRQSNAGYYTPPSAYDERSHDRRRRHDSRAESESYRGGEKKNHDAAKSVGATLLGGAVGAFAGHEVGHGGLATVIGAVAGAYGGHKLEQKREKSKEKRAEEREHHSQHGDYVDPYNGGKPRSRRVSGSSDSDSDSDGGGRRYHHRH